MLRRRRPLACSTLRAPLALCALAAQHRRAAGSAPRWARAARAPPAHTALARAAQRPGALLHKTRTVRALASAQRCSAARCGLSLTLVPVPLFSPSTSSHYGVCPLARCAADPSRQQYDVMGVDIERGVARGVVVRGVVVRGVVAVVTAATAPVAALG